MEIIADIPKGWLIVAAIGFIFWTGAWYNKVNSRLDTVEKVIEDIKSSIDKLSERIDKYFLGESKPVHTRQSPIQLNEFGNDLREAMESKKLTEKYLPDIEIDADDNEYQIQQHCFRYASNNLPEKIDEQERKALEAVAYETGAPMESLFGVLGVVFRDAKLEELGKDPAHIDTHDPDKDADKN